MVSMEPQDRQVQPVLMEAMVLLAQQELQEPMEVTEQLDQQVHKELPA